MNFELAFREYEKFVANDHCNPLDKYSKHVMYKVCVYACMHACMHVRLSLPSALSFPCICLQAFLRLLRLQVIKPVDRREIETSLDRTRFVPVALAYLPGELETALQACSEVVEEIVTWGLKRKS